MTLKYKRNYLPINNDELAEIIVESVNKWYRSSIFSDCDHCGLCYPGLGAQINADGRIQVKAYCTCCDAELTGGPISIPKQLREIVPVIRRSVGRVYPCSYRGCGSPYSQTHHIMPSSIDWDESFRFPTVQLCEEHHRLWHKLTGLGLGTTKTTKANDAA